MNLDTFLNHMLLEFMQIKATMLKDLMLNDFYDQANDSHIKWYEEIRKLTTRQGEDYTTGYLLDYDSIKNHYRLTLVDLRGQKELDADPKASLQIEFVGLLQLDANYNATDAAGNDQTMFVLTVLKFSQGSLTAL